MHSSTALMLVAVTLGLAGCTIKTDRPVTGLYVGVVYFKSSSQETAPLHRTDVTSFGVWSDNNIITDSRSTGIGWRTNSVLVANKECRVVFFIEEDAQAQKAAEIVRSEMGEGEGICVE